MNHRRKFSGLVVVAAGVAVAASALVGGGVASASTSYRAALQSAADRLVADGQPGAVILARNGETTVTVSAGDGDLATDTPIRGVDRFHIGSITKTFVATVVLQLVAEHRLTLDDSAGRWLPGLPTAPGYDWSKITVRELLRQTSGLRDYLDDPRFQAFDGLGATWQPAQLVDIAVHLGPPLSGWHYANTNYVLAGMLVQAVTGQSVAHEIQARVIDPLGLSATSFPATSTRIPAPFAHGYFTPYGDVTEAVNPSSAGAAGAMISDVYDVSRFYRALFSGRLLPTAQLRELTDAIPVDDDGGLYAERYGLGVYEVHLPCGTAWGHDGGYPGGFKSFAYTSPDGRRQAVLFYNDFGISDGTDNPSFRAAVRQATALAFCGSTKR